MWNRKFSEAAILAPKVCSTLLCAWKIKGSLKAKICAIGYVPQLGCNWRAYNRARFFKGFEWWVNWNFPEVAILAPKICFSMGSHWQFRRWNLYISIRFTVKRPKIGPACSVVLNYLFIGPFQKWPFWSQNCLFY